MRPTIHPDRWSLVFYSAILQQPLFCSIVQDSSSRVAIPRLKFAFAGIAKRI